MTSSIALYIELSGPGSLDVEDCWELGKWMRGVLGSWSREGVRSQCLLNLGLKERGVIYRWFAVRRFFLIDPSMTKLMTLEVYGVDVERFVGLGRRG